MDEQLAEAVAEAIVEPAAPSETEVALAEIHADARADENDTAVEIAEINADAAVAIAEAAANEVDEQWLRSQFDALNSQVASLSSRQAEMAEAISTLAMGMALLTPTPSPPLSEMPPTAETPPESAAPDGQKENQEAPPAKAAGAPKKRRWI